MCSCRGGGVVVAGSVKTRFSGGVHDGLSDGDILCLLLFVAVLAPRSFPRAPVHDSSSAVLRRRRSASFFRSCSSWTGSGDSSALSQVRWRLTPTLVRNRAVEAAASRDTVRAALAPTANLRVCSSSSAPSPPEVGGFGEKSPLRRRTLGEGAQPGLYRGGTRIWARGQTASGTSE
jgi:hypothetical protein